MDVKNQEGFTTNSRYPEISVELTGRDGNAFSILGDVRRALKKGGVPQDEVNSFFSEATSGDYNHLLATAMKWVNVS